MTPLMYNGRERAEELKAQTKKKISALVEQTGERPSLAIIKVNRSEATDKYTLLKQKAGAEVGAKVEIFDLGNPKRNYIDLIKLMRYLDLTGEYHGIMIQMPFPPRMKDRKDYILDTMPLEKDVDGMKKDSIYVMPTSLAILDAIEDYKKQSKRKDNKLTILVIGAKGHVGGNAVKVLREKGHEVRELDRSPNNKVTWKSIRDKSENVDLIVTATGNAGLLHHKNILEGIGVIDLGAPKPEVNMAMAVHKIGYVTPVPGGIGPVTIAYLLDNLYQAAYNQARKKSHTQG